MQIIKSELITTGLRNNHAASLCYYKGKRVLVWFSGDCEGARNSKIYYKIGKRGKIGLIPLPEILNLPMWNPVIFVANGSVHMFVQYGHSPSYWFSFFVKLRVNGSRLEVDKFEPLPAGYHGCTKCKPIELASWIYCGSSRETPWSWTSHIEQYDLNFQLQEQRNTPMDIRGSKGIIQPALWLKNTTIGAFFRSSDGLIYSVKDLEMPWNIEKTDLPNPNSGIDVVGDYLVYNNHKTFRDNLTLRHIETGKEFVVDTLQNVTEQVYSRELSYPFGVLTPSGNIMLAYTYGRSYIKVVEVVI